MSRIRLLSIVAVLVAALSPAASAVIDPDAEVILLRQDCGTLDDCFETVAAASTWTWSTRVPTASEPLLWDVGPGTWAELWSCPAGGGHVTVRGAGRERSFITGTASSFEAGNANGCEKLEFVDITFQHPNWAFRWVGAGSSTWNDVDLISTEGDQNSAAWFDDVCFQTQTEIALHYFFDSRLVVKDATGSPYPVTAWYGNCSEGWFFGGEMVLEVNENTSGVVAIAYLNDRADLRIFGSAVRAVASPPGVASIFGVVASTASTFHMHGGIISLTASSGNTSVFGALGGGGTIHTPDTAFNLIPSGTGTAKRVLGTGVQSPFLWQSGTTPPVSTEGSSNFESLDGQDAFIEIDCDSSGDCNGAGTETHLMIYNKAECGACMPWFDVVTGSCRPDPSPGPGGACDP